MNKTSSQSRGTPSLKGIPYDTQRGTLRGTPRSTTRGIMRGSHQDHKIGSIENVQDHVKPNEDVYSKCKFPTSLIFNENEEDGKNYEEVKDDDDDVCDSMTKEIGSSCNSPNVNIQDKVKNSIEGEVDDEPGGNVSARSRRLRFRQSKA